MKLFKHQKEAVKWLTSGNSRSIFLGDDMGLGKTISVLASIRRLIRRGVASRALIIAPACLIDNWKAECLEYMGYSMYVYRGKNRDKQKLKKHRIAIMSYEILVRDFMRSPIETDILVLDEVHNIKNPESLRTKAVLKVKTTKKIGMSGTLIWDTPDDLWSLLRWADKDRAPDRVVWNLRYLRSGVTNIRTRYGFKMVPKVVGYRNLPELHQLLDKYMLRRTKEQCLDIPEKQVIYSPYPMDSKTDSLLSLWKDELKDAPISAALIRFQQVLSGTLKRNSESPVEYFESSKIQYLRQLMDDCTGQMLVWFKFRETLWNVVDNIPEKVFVIDGTMSMSDRSKTLAAWKRSRDGKLFATIRAAGTGLNMQNCSYAVFFEMEYVPSYNKQAEDRIYRIGQTKKTTIIYLYAPGTIEQAILDLYKSKHKLNKVVITGQYKAKLLRNLYNKVYTLFGDNDPSKASSNYKRYMGN